MRERKKIILSLIIVVLITQFSCEAGKEFLIRLNPDYGPYELDDELRCLDSGREWIYDEENAEWKCDYSKPPEPAPEPPLWNPPEESASPEPEAVETLEPEECNKRASVDIVMGSNDNTVCDCAYFVYFTSSDETILYYRTQTYNDPADPTQRWQVERLYADQTWTWSSETIKDGGCVPAAIDMYTVFIAVEGCDNMYKKASWAIDEYAQPLSGLCQ